jgi:hypothetical protein
MLNCTDPIIGATEQEKAGHIGVTLQQHLMVCHPEALQQIGGLVALFNLAVLARFFKTSDEEATAKSTDLWNQVRLLNEAQWSVVTTAPPHAAPTRPDLSPEGRPPSVIG